MTRRMALWTATEADIAATTHLQTWDAGDYLRITAEYTDPEGTENKTAQVVSANVVRSGSDVTQSLSSEMMMRKMSGSVRQNGAREHPRGYSPLAIR